MISRDTNCNANKYRGSSYEAKHNTLDVIQIWGQLDTKSDPQFDMYWFNLPIGIQQIFVTAIYCAFNANYG